VQSVYIYGLPLSMKKCYGILCNDRKDTELAGRIVAHSVITFHNPAESQPVAFRASQCR